MADLVTNDEVNTYLGTSGVDYSAEIKRASHQVVGKIGPVIFTPFTEYHDGGQDRFLLDYNAIKTDSVTITDTETGRAIPENAYIVDKSGVIYKKSGLWYYGRYQITYEAGLVDSTANVPADIKQATLMLIEDMQQKESSGYVKEKIGDYSYEKFDSDKVQSKREQAMALLEPYGWVGGI